MRDLLIRSKLPGRDLAHVWTLSDTTKSGKLLFPEFALAMYLCNLKIVGKDLPQKLPDRIANEVSDMVDKISFGVPDDKPATHPQDSSLSIRQPQPQTSNVQLLNQLNSQPTGFASRYVSADPTGLQPQMTAVSTQHRPPQPQMQVPHMTGSFQNTSGQSFTPSVNNGQYYPSQPVLSGQQAPRLGLVNAPVSGLPNLDELQRRLMPQAGREGGFTDAGLAGNATVPWAVTKDEKRIYDQLFRAWDGLNRGFIGGETAIELMGQSGLPKSDLEKIWTLSDPSNKGRLDIDEFAVAMHLMYRRLNGYPVPNRLPPELVPPSTKTLNDSIGTMKSLLSQDAQSRKGGGGALHPQNTGVSYLKSHSFRAGSSGPGTRKDATVFRNNDEDFGYKSSARRRVGAGGRTPSPSASVSSAGAGDDTDLNFLRKQLREKEVLLEAIDFRDEAEADEDASLDRVDRRGAEDLKMRIRRTQEDIDHHPDTFFHTSDTQAERRALMRRLQRLTDRLPELTSSVLRTEQTVFEARLELFGLRDSKQFPNSGRAFGSGPDGSMTKADMLKARAKAMMQQRSAALSGHADDSSVDDFTAASKRLEEETSKARFERENNERIIRGIEEGVQGFSKEIEDSMKDQGESSAAEHEKRRWEDGLGVENEVQELIYDLQRSSQTAKTRNRQ